MARRIAGTWLAGGALVAAVAAAGLLRADVAVPRAAWTPVRMESETVRVRLGQEKAAVEAVFTMYNHGDDHTCKMGFPLGLFEDALNDFAVAMDGEAVKDVRTVDSSAKPAEGKPRGGAGGAAGDYPFDGPYKQWKVWDMPMKANQQRTVKVTYWVKPATIKDAKHGNLKFYSYTMKTGATWKGNIGSAEVRLALDDVKPDQIVRRAPAGYKTAEGGKVSIWKMEDFKPTEDIEVAFKPAAKVAQTAGR